MNILKKKLGITYPNLVRIVEQWMIDVRFHARGSAQTYAELEKSYRYNPPEVILNNKIAGWAYAIPLTELSSFVIVEANANPGEDVSQLKELSDLIIEILDDGNENQLNNEKPIEFSAIEICALAWVDRDCLVKNLPEFLSDWYDMHGEGTYYSVYKIKKVLRLLESKGVITKDEKGRWRRVKKSP